MKKEIKVEDMNTMANETIKENIDTPKVKLQKLKDLEGKFLLVKVGNASQPATQSQIDDVQDKLVNLLDSNNINCLVFVTHHAVSMEIIEKQR